MELGFDSIINYLMFAKRSEADFVTLSVREYEQLTGEVEEEIKRGLLWPNELSKLTTKQKFRGIEIRIKD